MTKREMIKPFSWGFVAGGIALTIVAFSAGWVVTSGANNHQVRAAWVDGQATICSSLAQAHRKTTGDVSDISGYQARDARDGLAKAYAIVLPGQETADPSVISSCSDMLNKSTTS